MKLSDLQADETFVTTTLQAFQAALRNHQAEKREALRNAVLNTALPSRPEESLQQMFLAFVDTCTVWHLRLLKLLHHPEQLSEAHKRHIGPDMNASMAAVLEGEYPELRGQKAFYVQVLADLYQRGLLDEAVDLQHGGLRDGQRLLPPGAFKDKRTTVLGDSFLAFIEEPSALPS